MQYLSLNVAITADNADEVIGKLKALGATAKGEAAQGVSELSDSTSVLSDHMTEVSEQLARGVLGFAAIGGAVYQAVEHFKEFAATGIDVARHTELLTAQLTLAGNGVNRFGDAADAAISSVSKLGLSTKDELTVALQRLALVTGDTSWSVNHLQAAQDLAAATGMDLVGAATDLARGYNGQWMELERLGLVTKEQVASGGAMDALLAKLQGMTAAATEGAGAWTQLGTAMKNAWEEGSSSFVTEMAPLAHSLSFVIDHKELAAGILGVILTHQLPAETFAALAATPATLGTPLPAGFGTMLGGGGFVGAGADVFGGKFPGPPQISLGPTEAQAKEQEKYAKMAEERAARAEAAAKRAEEAQARLDDFRRNAGMEEARRIIEQHKVKPGDVFGPGNQPPLIGTTAAYGEAGVAKGAYPKTAITEQYKQMGTALQKETEDLSKRVRAFTTSIHTELAAQMKDLQDKLQSAAGLVGGAISGGIQAGMSAGHHKLTAALDEMGKELLAAFGSYLVTQGEALLAAGALEALTGFFSASGAADLAAGAGLIALGGTLQGIGAGIGGGGGGGGASFRSATVSGLNATQYITPTAGAPYAAGTTYPGRGSAPQLTANFTIIGPADPAAQRAITQIVRRAARRGSF